MKLKNKTWNNPQIKNQEKSCELRLIRPLTQHKNPEHVYIKFLTTHQHNLWRNTDSHVNALNTKLTRKHKTDQPRL
jgi:hypothetical protein